MMKMKTVLLSSLILLLICCKANDAVKQLEQKSEGTIFKSTGLTKEVDQSSINKSLANMSDVAKDDLLKELKFKNKSQLENYYTEDYIDSLRRILYTDKQLKIKKNEDFLLDYLSQKKGVDTIVLAYLNVPVPSGGMENSFSYDVLQGDEIFYKIETGKKSINFIEFLVGEEVRVKLAKLKKNTIKTGSFKVLADNKLIINLSNKGLLKNFSLVKSQIKIKVKKPIEKMGTQIEFINDTVFVDKSIIETTTDTIYNLSDTRSITLNPTLDITQKSSINFPIIIDNKDLLGWGYWIGTNTKDILAYESLNDSDEAGIVFAKEELSNAKPTINLPVATNDDASILVLNESLDSRTQHYNKNFAFYKTDTLIRKGNKKATVKLSNRSSIYNAEINYRLFTAKEVTKKRKVVKSHPVITKSILVKLN